MISETISGCPKDMVKPYNEAAFEGREVEQKGNWGKSVIIVFHFGVWIRMQKAMEGARGRRKVTQGFCIAKAQQ